MIAGPSEILVLADETADPAYLAADLMSQAEHDKMASAILLTTSETVAEQTVEEDFVESGSLVESNLTVGKLRRALTMLQKNEAWSDERRAYGDELVLACSSSQINALLQQPEVTSYDYNTVRALAEGKIDTFLGFRIIRTEQ